MIYTSTLGLRARHPTFSIPKLVRISMEGEAGGDIKLTVVSGHHLGRIPGISAKSVSWAEFQDRPRDNIEEARWAFSKFGLEF